MTPEERADAIIELVTHENGYQSARFVGQSNLLWHSADRELMAERLASIRSVLVAVVTAAIAEAVAAERERCAKIAEDAADRQEHFGSDLYTQHIDHDRECFRHAASRLRYAATDIRKGGMT